MVHIHARDKDGSNTYKKEVYRDIITRVRKQNRDIVIVVSTSGRTFADFEKRAEVLELDGEAKPDMASLTLGSINLIRWPALIP